MAQCIAAIGLVLVIEGLLFAAFPRAAKRLAASALESPETSLRVAGIVSGVLGRALLIEARLSAAFPRAAKRWAASALESPETSLRVAGIVSAVLGIVLIWI